MSAPFEGFSASSVISISAVKKTMLNPSAEEYIPLSSRETTITGISDTTGSNDDAKSRIYINGLPDQSVSGALNESEDEARLFWPSRLPNDITPDIAENEYYRRHLCNGKLKSSLAGSQNRPGQMDRQSSAVCGAFIRNSRDKLVIDGYNGKISPREGGSKSIGSSIPGYLNDSVPEQSIVDASHKDLEFLVLKFRSFPVEKLAKVYWASGYDLNLAIKVITQLQESWRSGSSNGNICSSSDKLPSPSSHDALPKYSDQEFRRRFSPIGPLNYISNDEIELAETLGKLAFLDTSGGQKHARDGSCSNTDSSRNIVPSSSTFGGQKASLSSNSRSSASTYSLSENEACELACLRSSFYLQSEQAYLNRCKALFAKELSLQQPFLMNMASPGKAGQTSHHHRNNAALGRPPGSSSRQVPRIDLTGLATVQEVMHVLKQELGTLMRPARLAGHRLEAVICTGIGHPDAEGSWKAPPGIAAFVEQFLRDAGLEYQRLRNSMFHVFLC